MIEVQNVTIQAGTFHLKGLSLHVPAGSYGVLMGETGCGKSTLLESICGLRKVHVGNIVLEDKNVTHLPPANRNVGYVPQDAALFPRMNVRQHLTFPLEIRGWSKGQRHKRTGELAELLNLNHLLDRSTRGLSGGEIQRVALGRALSWRPGTLLLDEPLSALDDDTREEMYAVLKLVQRETRVSVLHVTHSSTTAQRLADCRFRMCNQRIVAATDGSLSLKSVAKHSA